MAHYVSVSHKVTMSEISCNISSFQRSQFNDDDDFSSGFDFHDNDDDDSDEASEIWVQCRLGE